MKKEIIFYILVGILILGLISFTFFPDKIYTAQKFNKEKNNLCTPTSGYTEEEWKEHMGHHPEIYKECLD